MLFACVLSDIFFCGCLRTSTAQVSHHVVRSVSGNVEKEGVMVEPKSVDDKNRLVRLMASWRSCLILSITYHNS